jgi:hypothetical protein
MKKVFRVYGTAHYDACVMVEAETAEEALQLAVKEGESVHNVERGDFMEFEPSDATDPEEV